MCSKNARTLIQSPSPPIVRCLRKPSQFPLQNCHPTRPMPAHTAPRATKHGRLECRPVHHTRYKSSPVITMTLSYNVSNSFPRLRGGRHLLPLLRGRLRGLGCKHKKVSFAFGLPSTRIRRRAQAGGRGRAGCSAGPSGWAAVGRLGLRRRILSFGRGDGEKEGGYGGIECQW